MAGGYGRLCVHSLRCIVRLDTGISGESVLRSCVLYLRNVNGIMRGMISCCNELKNRSGYVKRTYPLLCGR